MGFFSWNCCGCQKPVMSSYAVGNSSYSETSFVVLLNPDGTAFKGVYDGYGRVDDPDFDPEANIADRDYGRGDGVRWYHDTCYRGQSWAETPPAKNDPGQGYFYGDDDLDRLFGPAPAAS